MGAVTAGVSAGLAAKSLLDARKKNKKDMERMQQEQIKKNKTRKNLLDEQLASQRANMGAMGIGYSGSSAAVSQRKAKEAYDDIDENNKAYGEQIDELGRKSREDMFRGTMGIAMDVSGKTIK